MRLVNESTNPAHQQHGAATTDDDQSFGGFRSTAGMFPMRALIADTKITGLTYRSTLRQRFVNAYSEVLEATYIFPLPARAAVTACKMTVGERVITAELMERRSARENYEQAIQRGHRAALAEEERSECFTMTVGNIVPGDVVTVELELVGQLAWDDGQASYRFPLVVAPKYIPGTPLPMTQSGNGHALDADLVPLSKINGLPSEVANLKGRALAVRRFDRGPSGSRVHIEDFVYGLRWSGIQLDRGIFVRHHAHLPGPFR